MITLGAASHSVALCGCRVARSGQECCSLPQLPSVGRGAERDETPRAPWGEVAAALLKGSTGEVAGAPAWNDCPRGADARGGARS